MIKFIIGYSLIIYWAFFLILSTAALVFIIMALGGLTKSIINEEEMPQIEPDYPKHTDKTIYKSSHIPIPSNIKKKYKK